MLIKIATDLRVARASESTLCFAAAKMETIFSGTLLVELALDFLACLTKIDNIAHAGPSIHEHALDNEDPDPEAVSLRKMRP